MDSFVTRLGYAGLACVVMAGDLLFVYLLLGAWKYFHCGRDKFRR